MGQLRNWALGVGAAGVILMIGARGDAGNLNPPPGPVSPTMTPLSGIAGSIDDLAAFVQQSQAAEGGPSVAGDPLLSGVSLLEAGSMYLQVPEAPGDVTTSGFVNWISVANYSLEAGSFGPGMEGGFGPLRVLQVMDKSTPKLFDILARGTNLGLVKLHARSTGANPIIYFKVELTNATISKITPFFGGRAMIVEYDYQRLELTYTPLDPMSGQADDPILFCWDAMKGMPCN